MTIKWKRPSGTILETNERDVTVAYCEKLGFTRINEDGGEPKESTKVIEPVKYDSVAKKKAGRPKKVVAD